MNKQIIHSGFRPLLIFCAAVAIVASPLSHAQTEPGTQALPTRDQSYLRNLIRLSEIIGSAHAVRVRCNGVDDQYWRSYMVQILGIEASNQGNLRTRMVGGFNDGYEREDRQRQFCDASSNEVEAGYAADGRRISEELAAFYFPKQSE